MKLVFARRALREIDRSARWWIEHRDARSLFEEELTQALQQIKDDPNCGQLYRRARGREQRRVLMPKTSRHIYFRREDPERILILSMWGARRGRGPKL